MLPHSAYTNQRFGLSASLSSQHKHLCAGDKSGSQRSASTKNSLETLSNGEPARMRWFRANTQTLPAMEPGPAIQQVRKHVTVVRHLCTPWSEVLLQKLNGSQLVKTFPAFHGTRRFITAFTTAHLNQSSARSIKSKPPPSHFLKIHLYIMRTSTPQSSKWSRSLRFPH